MRYDETNEIRDLAFDFFYWFSRFEFALKEAGYLKNNRPGFVAEPGWDQFVTKWKANYKISEKASQLLATQPKRQEINEDGVIEFKDFNNPGGDLERVVRVIRVVRNNVFHGGKHGNDDWDDRKRMMSLLELVIAVLDELAEHSALEADYRRYY